MSKQHQIKWRESDTKELTRVVKNFNAKLSRLIKKNPEQANILPSFYNDKTKQFENRITVNQLKDLIATRQDLNRELNALKRFSKRGAEDIVEAPDNDYNVRLTRWQRTEMNRRIGVINRKREMRKDRLRAIEMMQGDKNLGYTVGQFGMGKMSDISLQPMNAFTRRMSQNDIKMKFRSILNESASDYFTKKDFRVRENYIRGLEQTYKESDIADIVAAIRSMDIDEFLNKFEADGGTFEFASDLPSNDLYSGYVEHLKTIWIPNK